MKRIALFILIAIVFNGYGASAQIWKWGSEATGIYRTSNGYYGYNNVSGIASDRAGNSYLTGNFNDTLIFGSTYLYPTRYLSFNRSDMFLVKYDISGTLLWAHQSINSLTATSNGNAVATDAGGNVYVAGTFSDTVHFGSLALTSASQNCYLVKYAPNGNVVWVNQSVSPSQYPLSQGVFNSVAIDKSGNVYVTGNFEDTISFGPYTLTHNSIGNNLNGMFLAKYDSSGNILWAEQPDFCVSYFSSAVAADKWGNVYLTGGFNDSLVWGNTKLLGSNIADEAFTIKLDSGGKPLWARQSVPHFFKFLYISDFSGNSIATDNAGNVYIAGTITDTSSFGAVTLPSNRINNIFLAKYDVNGNVSWAKASTIPNSDDGWKGLSVVTDTNNNYVYLLGEGGASADIDQSERIVFETDTFNFNHSNGNSVIIKLDTSGKFICGNSIPDAGANSIALDPATKDIYLGGRLGTAARFGPDSLNGGASFIAKWQPCSGCALAINILPQAASVCSGKSISLTASGGNDYSWYPAYYLNTSSGSNVTASPVYNITYTITGNDSLGCSGSATSVITVTSSPFAGFIFSTNGNTVAFTTDSGSSDVSSYLWDFGDSTTSSKANPLHTFNGSGIFNVCLTVYNNSNCSYTICKDVNLLNTGIENVSENNFIHLYPNPANNLITLSTDSLQGKYQLKIYNVLGQPVKQQEVDLSQTQNINIDLQNFGEGAYELVLMNGRNYCTTQFVHFK